MDIKEKPKAFSKLINSGKPVLVDFFADWCGPCKMMKPILQTIKNRFNDKTIILKIDVDRNPKVASFYKIQGVPTLILFKNGEVIWRQAGVVRAYELEKIINSHL